MHQRLRVPRDPAAIPGRGINREVRQSEPARCEAGWAKEPISPDVGGRGMGAHQSHEYWGNPRHQNRSLDPGLRSRLRRMTMSHALGRRTATAAATLTVAVGALLAVGGTASAASGPAVDRTAAVAFHSASAARYGNDHADNRSDSNYDGRSDRNDAGRYGRWNDHESHRYDRGENRWDGHRRWHRTNGDWYSSDRGERYRYDGHRFYRWEDGSWCVGTGDAHDFDHGIFY